MLPVHMPDTRLGAACQADLHSRLRQRVTDCALLPRGMVLR